MSVENNGLNLGGFAGALPKRSAVTPSMDSLIDTGTATGLASAGSRAHTFLTSPITQKWARDTESWGTRTALAEVGDRYIKVKGDEAAGATTAALGSYSYSKLLHLGEHTMPKFTWQAFRETVGKNFNGFFSRLKDARSGKQPFFQLDVKNASGELLRTERVTPGSFLRNTVVGENIKPIKALFTGGPDRKWGSGLSRMLGLGIMAYGVLDETKQVYDEAKAQEDGSFGSKMSTLATTAKTFVGRTAKSLITWEAAGLAFHLGKNLLPIMGIPFGGVVIGALAGSVIYNNLNKIIPTGPKNPKPEGQSEEPPADNPFKAVTV